MDIIIALVLFGFACAIGMGHVATWGRTALFYQNLFGPAVMFACGRGYVNPDLSQAPELNAFLSVIDEVRAGTPPDIDAFSKDDLPPDIQTKPFHPIQLRERYLIGAAGLVWRVAGVSWAALTPLYGLLFGASVAVAYALFRLGTGRVFAVLCAAMFMTSPIHLQYLPELRDYSKAPFILAALFLTACLVKKPLGRVRLAGVAALCGAVIGIGLGFRIDVLICIPAFLVVVLFFLPGKARGAMATRVLATVVFGVAFLVTSWPIVSGLGSAGNKWHPAFLGFMAPFSERLGVGGTTYEFGHKFLDVEPLAILNAYARHLDPEAENFVYETPEYERVADAYAPGFLKTFPSDVAIRAYAAVLRILDELHAGPAHLTPPGVTNPLLVKLYELRLFIERHAVTHVRYLAVLVLCAIAAHSLRWAFVTLGLLLYFAGYSAVQYGTRNCFHLEVIPLWIVGAFWGYVLWHAPALCRREAIARFGQALRETRLYRSAALWRVACFVAISVVGLLVPLYALRGYQRNAVGRLLNSYVVADKERVTLRPTPIGDGRVLVQGVGAAGANVQPWEDNEPYFRTEFLVAEFQHCGRDVPITIRYEADGYGTDLTWTQQLPLAQDAAAPGAPNVTRVFFPVYYANWVDYVPQWDWVEPIPQWIFFRGIEIADADATALKGLYRITDPAQFPIVLTAVLPPNWASLPQYQRLVR